MKKIISLVLLVMFSILLFSCKKKDLALIASKMSIFQYTGDSIEDDILSDVAEISKKENIGYEISFSNNAIARYDNNIIKITRPEQTETLTITITLKYGKSIYKRNVNVFVKQKKQEHLPNPEDDIIVIPIDPNTEPEPIPAPEPDPTIPEPIIKNDFPIINAKNKPDNTKVTAIGYITGFPINFGVSLQDSSAGIIIKSGKDDSVNFNAKIKPLIGKYVKVTGEKTTYKGQAQITKIESIEEVTENIQEQYPQAFDASLVDIEKNKDKLQGTLLNIKNAKVKAFEKDSERGNISVIFHVRGKNIKFRFDSRTDKEKWDPILTALEVGKSYNLNNILLTIFDGAQLAVSNKFSFEEYKNISNKVNVFFNLQGGMLANLSPQIIDKGGKAINPGSPTKKNFEFVGWSKTGLSSDIFDFNTQLENDITLIAIYKYLGGGGDFNDVNGYYNDAKNLAGEDLRRTLQRIITKPEANYETAKQALAEADESLKKPGKLFLIYTGDSDNYSYGNHWAGGNNWNREHVVPQSKLGSIGKGELHNLRAADKKINSNRGNLSFVDGSGEHGKIKRGYYPGDEHVGDVARILLFMHTRHNYPLDKICTKSLVLKWHRQDPVDEFEIRRNEIISRYQGNRNPFIDNPQFADLIFGTSTSINIDSEYNFSNLIIPYIPNRRSFII